MSLTTIEFERGVRHWRNTKWPGDFHNAFYQQLAADNPHGSFDYAWWTGFLPVLRQWRATRPRGDAFLTPRASQRFRALNQAWAMFIEPNLKRDIADIAWVEVSAFPKIVSEIKDVTSPVFTSKFCHFLAPAIFPVVDNAAMGNPYLTYEECLDAYRASWLGTDSATQRALVALLASLIGAPLFKGYPIKNKIVELCLIGRHQG